MYSRRSGWHMTHRETHFLRLLFANVLGIIVFLFRLSTKFIFEGELLHKKKEAEMTNDMFKVWEIFLFDTIFRALRKSQISFILKDDKVQLYNYFTILLRNVGYKGDISIFQVAWVQVDTQTILTIHQQVITRNPRITLARDDHKSWHLHIKDLQEQDRGWYMCQVNTDPMRYVQGYLDVVGRCWMKEKIHEYNNIFWLP